MEECDRSLAASAAIGYATERARWNLGLGLRSAIAPLAAKSIDWHQLRYGKSQMEFRAGIEECAQVLTLAR